MTAQTPACERCGLPSHWSTVDGHHVCDRCLGVPRPQPVPTWLSTVAFVATVLIAAVSGVYLGTETERARIRSAVSSRWAAWMVGSGVVGIVVGCVVAYLWATTPGR